jgi:hypothetical protein
MSETAPTEKVYHIYRTFSGNLIRSDKEIFYAEKISKSTEQMAAESPEIKQSS